MPSRKIKRALLSVYDKTGLIEFARDLAEYGVELISTGGTAKALKEAGLPVIDVSEVTGFPEILDGRVKTVHPRIHAGILAVRDNDKHMQTLQQQEIAPIDLVVCNLYPFEKTVSRADATHAEIIENIDIGGPSMVRAAAKNYQDVAVVTEPGQYPQILKELVDNDGSTTLATREKLAAAAFARTAAYDVAISSYFHSRTEATEFPEQFQLAFQKKTSLRYGENPHQKAALYTAADPASPGIANAEQLHGKELSFNNILDCDSAYRLAYEFGEPAAVVVKHNNPCGAAVAATLAEAFAKAWEGDPLSAFGGILAFNRKVDEATAKRIADPQRFLECIVAPSYDDAALALLTAWKKNVRLLRIAAASPSSRSDLDYRRISGGMLLQQRDGPADDFANIEMKTKRQPTSEEMAVLRFAWVVCKHVKSNAIVLAKDSAVVGVGAGQMSRVDAVHLAARKAGDKAKGSVLASDAFFPFRDNIDEAAKAGVNAIVQPGGSMRDQESIDACDEHGMAMIFTGVRHFRH